jgi:signal transduction histidine kinase
MTLYYSLILIAILIATNLSIYFVMVNYTNYQMSSEISRMLDGIQGSEWLYENNEASTEESSEESSDDSDSDSESDSESESDSSSHSEVALPGVNDLIIPQTLKTFPVYMVYDASGQLITWKSDNDTTFDTLLIKSKDLKISDNPSIVTLVEPSALNYLMAKMPIVISDQTLGYYVVARDVTIAYQTLENLSKILVFSLIAGIFFSAVLGYLIAGKSLRPIKEAYQSKQEFLANASHELRTPLSVILLSTETLEGEIDPSLSFQRQVVSGIGDEAQKMNHLVSQLLFLSRTDSQTGTAKYEHFNLSESLSKEIVSYEKIALAKGISLSQSITPGLKIHGDRKQLLSVFSILIDNAIKYSQDNGHVYVALEKNSDNKKQGVKLIVKDTGIGIPETEIKHIFERFYRLESSRSKETGGYGLGLAIAKEIVDQHKGTIRVDSIEKVGTTFVVEL